MPCASHPALTLLINRPSHNDSALRPTSSKNSADGSYVTQWLKGQGAMLRPDDGGDDDACDGDGGDGTDVGEDGNGGAPVLGSQELA